MRFLQSKAMLWCFCGLTPIRSTGCPPDDPVTTEPSSSTTSTGDDTGITSTPTTTGIDVCPEPPEPAGGAFAVHREPELETMVVFNSCSDLATLGFFPGDTEVPIQIWRPATATDSWPNGRFPVVVFSPGQGQGILDVSTGLPLYSHIVDPLVAEGFIVVGLDLQSNFDLETSFRWRAMICAMRWVTTAWTEAQNDRTNCDLIAMGHSRGGEAAFQVIENFPAKIADPPRRLAAAIGIAPRSSGESDEGSFPILSSKAVPYLILMGGSDEDVGGGDATRAYDIMASEEDSPLAKSDKVLLWAYDVPHNAWGGKDFSQDNLNPPIPTGTQLNKGRAIAGAYIPAFLKWQVLHRDPAMNRQLFTTLVKPTALVGEFPLAVQSPAFWSTDQPPFEELDGRPLIFADFALGSSDDALGPLQVDTMKRAGAVPCGLLSPSSSSGTVVPSGLLPSQVCIGSAAELSSQFSSPSEHHDTNVMQISFGDQLSSGRVRWSLAAPPVDFSFLSLRIGQSYDPAVPSAVEVGVILHGQIDVQVSLGLQVRQDDSEIDPVPSVITDFMRTVRVPLGDFCAQGLDLTTVTGISIVVPPSTQARTILLDSLEFTRASEDGVVGCN